jgi:ribosomal protein S18 acetylase RimI-like enzyme
MEVRRFEGRRDAEEIIRLEGRAWREAYGGLLPEAVLESKPVAPDEADVDRWLEAIRESEDGVLVAVDDGGDICGFVEVRWGDAETKALVGEDEAEVNAIYVDPDHWGEGIGTALLDATVRVLPTDIDTIRLETLSGNELGRRFYEARGFVRTGSGTFEIGDNAYETDVYTLRLPTFY